MIRFLRLTPHLFFVGILSLTLSACGGSSSSSSSGGNSSSSTGGPSGKISSLNVTINNLQGDLVLNWKGEQYEFNEQTQEGQFTSTIMDNSNVTFTEPKHQNCRNFELDTVDQNYTITINCTDPFQHTLNVFSINLKEELMINWGSQQTIIDNINSNATVNSNDSEEFTPIVEFLNPDTALQECISDYEEVNILRSTLNINCTDLTAVNLVNIESPLSYPVTLELEGEQLLIQEESKPFNLNHSRYESVSLEDTSGLHFCTLIKDDFLA